MAVKDIPNVVALQVIVDSGGAYPMATELAMKTGQPIKVALRKLEQLRSNGLIASSLTFPLLTEAGNLILEASV